MKRQLSICRISSALIVSEIVFDLYDEGLLFVARIFHILCMSDSLSRCHLSLAEAVNAQTRSDTGTTGSVESPNWMDLRPAAKVSVECHSPALLTGIMNILGTRKTDSVMKRASDET